MGVFGTYPVDAPGAGWGYSGRLRSIRQGRDGGILDVSGRHADLMPIMWGMGKCGAQNVSHDSMWGSEPEELKNVRLGVLGIYGCGTRNRIILYFQHKHHTVGNAMELSWKYWELNWEDWELELGILISIDDPNGKLGPRPGITK